jgi:general secretion pathway protein D
MQQQTEPPVEELLEQQAEPLRVVWAAVNIDANLKKLYIKENKMFKKITTLISISVLLLIPGYCLAQGGGRGGGMGGMGGTTGGGRGGVAGGFAGGSSTGATSSIVGTDQMQFTLIPLPERNLIIARAPAELMEEIAKLIEKFDMADTNGVDYDTINVMYVNVDEVATSLLTIMDEISSEFRRNVSIQPLAQSRQLLVFGKKEYREMVKKLITEIDLPSNQLQRKTFQLKYADPSDIKEKIDELFNLTGSTSTSTTRTTTSRTSSGSTSGGTLSADTVLTTIYPSLRQIVVLASEANMKEIEKQIADWDSPFVWESLKPRIISVKNVDPVQLVTLLNSLFSSSSTTSGSSSTSGTRQLLSSTSSSSAAAIGETIMGPLYGKLTFIEIPDTKKIIVASNVAEAYDAIEKFINEIDAEDLAVVPKVVAVKYADPEDLSKRLNTIFAEAGTTSSIDMSDTGLSLESYINTSTTTTSTTTDTSYTPPWSGSGGTTSEEEMPISNVFGKVRFMPEPNTKSILLLAPEQYMSKLEELIAALDVTGKQVMIETVIVEVEHNTMTSLGFEFSSDGTALSSIGRYGFNTEAVIGNPTTYSGQTTQLESVDDFFLSGFNLTMFVDFLKKNGNARILNQQTLWTKDNDEANFFKGKQIPFVTGTTSTTSSTGAVVASDTYEFKLVGMEVRVRPRITPENNVGMIINVNYSQQTGDKGLGNMDILSQMNTTTNMIIQNSDTLILGGILFQKDSTITYKIPGLGDIPIIGKLFGHDTINKENTELLVFITPRVIDQAPENIEKIIDAKTKEIIESTRTRMGQIRSELDNSMKGLRKE